MNNTPERPVLLRSEAIPVACYSELTRDQRIGLRQLLRRLNTALTDLDNRLEVPTRPAWISNDRLAQLAFIDGQRGTGKTTLMVTLVRLIVTDPNDDFYHNFIRNDGVGSSEKKKIPPEEDFSALVKPLKDRIVVLEPLDMEPLPKSTPLLAAILARLSSAAREFDPGRNEFRGLLDPTLDDNHDFIRFQQFQAKIARALDGNLDNRSGSLDREQYGQAVMEQEQDRLQIRQTLDDVLNQLTKAIGGNQGNPQRCMFLVPVDDVDLNPDRCLELLRLLRIYSPPQLYFLLMGQFDLVKSIVNMSMTNEYEQVRPLKPKRRTAADELLERKILEVAAANLQKMVPDVIELPQLSIQEIMTFRPTGMQKNYSQDKQSQTLGDLFKKIKLKNSAVLPAEIGNLYQLLMFHRDPDISRNQNSSDFQIGTYPGLGAFQVTLRKLVDLYRDLYEALREEALVEKPKTGQSNLLEEDLVLRVFDRYWEKIVSEDALLDSESRERLQREGIDACEVVPGSEDLVFNHYSIDGALVNIFGSSNDEEATYQPLLSIADLNQNDGLPRLQISRPYNDHVDASLFTGEIIDSRTRCAYVLIHDLRVARASREQDDLLTGINISSPVTMLWRSESGKTVSVPWPVPRLPSFAKVTALFHEISNDLKVSRSKLTRHRRSIRLRNKNSRVLKRFQSISQHLLEELVRSWVINGQNAILSVPNDGIGRKAQWGTIVTWLEKNAVRNSALQNDWFMQIVMLTLPETCALDLIVKPRHLEKIDDAEQRHSVVKLLEFSLEHVQELKGRRSQQFDTLWTDEFRDLWIFLNDKFTDDSWINLKLRQPIQRTRNEFRIALDEFGEDFSKKLEGTENRLAFEMELNSIRGMIQQGESQLDSNALSACNLLSRAAETAEKLYELNPKETKLAFMLIDAAEFLGNGYTELLSPRKSYEQYLRAVNVISTINQKQRAELKLRQLRLNLKIARLQFFTEGELSVQDEVSQVIEECREKHDDQPENIEWNKLYVEGITLQGIIQRELGNYNSSESTIRYSIELLSSSQYTPKEDNYAIEWARSFLSSVLRRKGDLESSKQIAEDVWKSVKINAGRQIANNELQDLHLFSTRLLSQILLDQNHLTESVDLAREAVTTAERHSQRNITSMIRIRDLARSRVELARVLRLFYMQSDNSRNHIQEALGLLDRAIPELERINSFDPFGYETAFDLGTGYLELARISRIMDASEKAEENLGKAINAMNRALDVDPNKAPVLLKIAEVHWEAYKNTKSTKQKHEHRAVVEDCLESARESNNYFYSEIQEIERELSKQSRKSPRSKKKR
ncbi:tetratricopeptide repeat protein [Gimesia algae]|uniref:Tetratricopeptide repeat protein n=1 Tax=Gimesia algae TaxID=2527971 RepID=A0A517VBU8_9PLAN|nr:hypothetical protein [Gimesia algae]QDT90466.1 hypothetical protein Pan161_21180 [Gimesia algae]